MSTQVQRRKGTTAQHASFTGASAELTVDTTKNTVVVHDGVTAGGIPLAKETGSAISVTSFTSSGAASIETTDNTNAALRITQLGSGNALLVEDSANPDASPTVIDASGNLGIGTTSPGAKLSVEAGHINMTTDYGARWRVAAGGAYNGSMLFDAGNNWIVQTGSALTERMRLDSAGNLGIGTTSPARKLDVNGAVRIADANVIEWGGTSTALVGSSSSNTMQFFTASSERMRLDSSGNLALGLTSADARLRVVGAGVNPGAIRIGHNGTSVNYIDADTNIFRTGAATEVMRLDASGNLLVGTSAFALSNTNSALIQTAGATCALILQHSNSNPSGNAYQLYAYNGTSIGSITQNGTTAVAYNTSSDYRLKNITGPITTSGAYIDSLKPVEGTWKADGSTFVGLIAHETQEVSRTAVATGTKDGAEMQGMDYSSAEIIANLIAELQSLRARVASLESK